jgi:CelD/BcsL family acetyltransferase involved in cellulose biosynthesis
MRRPSPYLLHEWLLAWARHYVPPGRLRVVTAHRGRRLVGGFPLYVVRVGGMRVIRFLGGSQSALCDLVMGPDGDEDVQTLLLDAARQSGHDFADLFGFPLDGPLSRAREQARLDVLERVEAPILDLSPGFDAVYAAHTTSKRRNSDRRRARQLAAAGKIDVTIARSGADLLASLERACVINRRRWQGRSDGSDFSTPRGERFQQEAAATLAELGVPRIVTLALDGQTIAFHYSFLLGDRLFVHRLGFDPVFARFGPGWHVMLEALRFAADDGATLVEYLGGDETYKLELADRIEPLGEGVGMTRTLRGRAAAALTLQAITTRKRLKRSKIARRLYRTVGQVRAPRRSTESR